MRQPASSSIMTSWQGNAIHILTLRPKRESSITCANCVFGNDRKCKYKFSTTIFKIFSKWANGRQGLFAHLPSAWLYMYDGHAVFFCMETMFKSFIDLPYRSSVKVMYFKPLYLKLGFPIPLASSRGQPTKMRVGYCREGIQMTLLPKRPASVTSRYIP